MSTKTIKDRSSKSKSIKHRSIKYSKTKYSQEKVKHNTYKIIKLLSIIKKFNDFYKKLKPKQQNVLNDYKSTSEFFNINSYLYNNNKINILYIDDYLFNSIKETYLSNKKDITNKKDVIKDKNFSLLDFVNWFKFTKKENINTKKDIFEDIPKFAEFYINTTVIKNIKILDSIFLNSYIPKLNGSEILYRGIDYNKTIYKSDYQIGDEIIFKNFLSTSTEKDKSITFTNNNMCCVYILTKLKNIPYVYLPWYVTNKLNLNTQQIKITDQDEFEYLLPRNLKFKVKNITTGLKNLNYNVLSFEKLDEILKNNNIMSMNNSNIQDIIDKIYSKMTFIHLEFIEQLPITNISKYIYNNDDNVKLQIIKH